MKTALEVENKIQTRVREITPEQAADWLEKMERNPAYQNRQLDDATVLAMASDMRGGAWTPNPQPIVFDEDGVLIDGQHRLWAVFHSGVTITATVTTNWPKGFDTKAGYIKTINNIDRGRTRSIAQQWGLDGQKNSNNMASTVRSIAAMVMGIPQIRLTFPGSNLIREMFQEHIVGIFQYGQKSRQRMGTVVAPMALYHTINPVRAEEFAKSLFRLENLAQDSHQLILFKWLERFSQRRQTQIDRYEITRGTAYALRQFENNQRIGRIMSGDEAVRWLVDKQGDNAKKIREYLKVKNEDKLKWTFIGRGEEETLMPGKGI